MILILLLACTRLEKPTTAPVIAITDSSTSILTNTFTAEPLNTLTATPVNTITPTPTQTKTPTSTPTPTITSTPTLKSISSSNINQLKEIFRFGKGEITGLSWWPDDQTLAVTTHAGIFLHDADTFEELAYIEPPGNITPFYISLGPDGHTVASSDGDNLIQVWDATTGQITHVLTVTPIE